ncbi:MAG: DUF972 family protein [Firmicutes bacterium]|nr:DUF972 family protein [Bacillota bacterium]
MDISHRLVDAEEKLDSLRREIESIKSWAREIEEDNARLRQELFALTASRTEEPADNEQSAGEPAGRGHSNLERLYQEHFHICPYNFGQRRTEGCIFCQNFLERTRK